MRSLLPLYGHRNWIVIADAAYPAQSKPGIETILANEDQLAVVKKTLSAITAYAHILANVYVDRELDYVAENDAAGVSIYRHNLNSLLDGSNRKTLEHEQIIARLDHSAEVFRILIIKTQMTIPYTTVFFELDCGYWNAAAEDRLHQAMKASESK
ncbi:MAG: RbsD/FucU domain-containing protein [Acidobacteriaceae bacterium]|nr:RbsD/FucU domain-containing protein [Acidobacteriaceae bacterium]